MTLTAVHLLRTYRCTNACDHCFVWASPLARGDMRFGFAQDLLGQIARLGGVKTIYAEGGEPFLLYPVMLRALQEASRLGFTTGIVTNAYWAASPEDARVWLEPLRDLRLGTLSLSTDCYHVEAIEPERVQNARQAALELGISVGVLSGAEDRANPRGVMYRGRAAVELADGVPQQPWESFTRCPHEKLDEPKRVHVDAWGYVHLCQGLSMGNALVRPFDVLARNYHPKEHPIVAPLLRGGPARLVEEFELPLHGQYADACHLCYLARQALRGRFPELLGPPQMYGESGGG